MLLGEIRMLLRRAGAKILVAIVDVGCSIGLGVQLIWLKVDV
jgi:hypothetical protein